MAGNTNNRQLGAENSNTDFFSAGGTTVNGAGTTKPDAQSSAHISSSGSAALNANVATVQNSDGFQGGDFTGSQTPVPQAAPAPIPRPDFKSPAPAGDIILVPDRSVKKPKKILLISLIAFPIISGLVGIVLAISTNRPAVVSSSTINAFSEYSDFLRHGDDNNYNPDKQLFALSLVSSNYPLADSTKENQHSFVHTLSEKWENFYQDFSLHNNDEQLNQKVEEYARVVNYLTRYIDISNSLDGVYRIYEQGDEDDLKDYLFQNFTAESDPIFSSVFAHESDFFAEAIVYNDYLKKANCFTNTNADYDCAMNFYPGSFAEISSDTAVTYYKLTDANMVEAINDYVSKKTDALEASLRSKDVQ